MMYATLFYKKISQQAKHFWSCIMKNSNLQEGLTATHIKKKTLTIHDEQRLTNTKQQTFVSEHNLTSPKTVGHICSNGWCYSVAVLANSGPNASNARPTKGGHILLHCRAYKIWLSFFSSFFRLFNCHNSDTRSLHCMSWIMLSYFFTYALLLFWIIFVHYFFSLLVVLFSYS